MKRYAIIFLAFLLISPHSTSSVFKVQKRGLLSNLFDKFTNKNRTNEQTTGGSQNKVVNSTATNINGGEAVVEKKDKGLLGAMSELIGTMGAKKVNGTTKEGNNNNTNENAGEPTKSDKNLLGDIANKLTENVKKLLGMAEKVVKEVNEKAKTWTAKLTQFANLTREEKQTLLGLNLEMAADTKALKLNKTEEEGTMLFAASSSTSVPKQFDSRQQWPACASVIGAIADQSSCGSCWAVSTASVFNDRLCIQMVKAKKKPDLKIRYSALDLLTCSTLNKGCNGGVPKYAWDYITKSGIVTGSEWVDKAGCKPYPFPPKKFSNNQNELGTPKCNSACTNGAYIGNAYSKDKKYATNPTGWSGAGLELRMKQEIMANGPINVGMVVYEDLMYYAGGVYRHVSGGSLGGHAVRIIGWGEDKGVQYWLAANSWNSDWGEKGLFRIARGYDEGRIESLHIAFGTPKI